MPRFILLYLTILLLLLAPGAGAQCTEDPLATPLAGEARAASEPCTGDVFGDLVHILRHSVTGQPILAQRWVELPGPVTGYGWGYCPIAVDAGGAELAFVPYTCDPLDVTAVQEVDYFGRLNAGRTRERNQRMHFDEVISTIKNAGWVEAEGSGRLRFGYDCVVTVGSATCNEWKLVDSPMENLGLYTRLMKYGHLQTDPEEIDINAHGDPALPTVYHPALDAADWAKFAPSVRHLLPGDGTAACFPTFPPGGFAPACAWPAFLDDRDLVRAAGFVAGAADKNGHFTVDLVQYVNRILKITQSTETTVSTKATLPALVRDCWAEPTDPPSPSELDPSPVDPDYLPPYLCAVVSASELLPNYDLFYDVRERFVDFTPFSYVRHEWRSELVDVILPGEIGTWVLTEDYLVLPWIVAKNGPDGATNVRGYVLAANDALRWIEFVHEYEIPADLFTDLDVLFLDGFESGDTAAWSLAVTHLLAMSRR